MVNYKNGKIYVLISKSGKQYVGCTTEKLCYRKAKHVAQYKKWKKNEFNFISSFILFEEEGNVEISLLESYPCQNRDELESRERYWINNIQGGCVNINNNNKNQNKRGCLDYKKSKIYKLKCETTGKQYIDSTTQLLYKRKLELNGKYIKWNKTKNEDQREPYYEIMEGGNYVLELIEEYPCQDISELHERLEYWSEQDDYINKIKKRVNYEEKVKCEICGEEYFHKNHNRHVGSKNHLEWVNKKKKYEEFEERMIETMGCFRNEEGYICSLNEDGSITNYGCKSVFGDK